MKLNKETLREIIKEVLEEEDMDKLRSGEVEAQSMTQRKAMVQSGIDDHERAAIAVISNRLAQAARSGNILTGPLAIKLKQLNISIKKALGVQ